MSAMQRIIGLLMLLCCASFAMGQALAAEEIVYYHVNALGSPVAATDQSGQVVWREAYSPFGERIKYEDNGQNKLWFTGKPHDETMGLTYFGARWYDPVVGRFMAVDPVSFRENSIYSFNRYAYANNNPYKYVDPDGEVSIAVGAVVVVGLWVVSDIVLPSLGPQPAFDSGVVERAGFPIDAGIIKGTIGAVRSGFVLARKFWGAPKELGSFSASARNGVGQIYSANVTMTGKNISFGNFSIGTQRGFIGTGPKGAAELIGPMKELINFSQKNGANTITLTGRYDTLEGAALGGGKVRDSFSFSFPASQQGFADFLGTLRK